MCPLENQTVAIFLLRVSVTSLFNLPFLSFAVWKEEKQNKKKMEKKSSPKLYILSKQNAKVCDFSF